MREPGRYAALALAALLLGASTLAPAADTPVAQSAPDALDGVAHGAGLRLRWELLRRPADVRTQSRLILSNQDARPLPAQGWSLYMNFMERVQTGELSHHLVLEQVEGGLFRLRPGPGFTGLAPGQALDVELTHPYPLIKLARAPAGPYLVYDAAPDLGEAIADYQLLPVARPEAGLGKARYVTPADTYRRNAQADLLPAFDVPPVLPTPLHLERGAGRLPLDGGPAIEAPAGLAGEAALAASLFPASLPAGGPRLTLALGKVDGQASPEAYALSINAGGIAIVGNSAAGVAYGLQTLRDLMPLPGAASPSLPELRIVDAPRFAYRGFQLDVARNFHDKQTVFKWLDLMARYKLNTLHFHLTDDEGWRLEIAGLPELTDFGAVRGHGARPGLRLPPAYGSGPDPRDPHGSGYYSRADYIEILRYANARHIEVIPEIEMPGHARAAVLAMRTRHARLRAAGDKDAARYLLNDPADRSVYRSVQMYTDDVIDPGLESTFAFIDHVVTQIASMHREAGAPLHTIHMGGDELAKGAWEQSPASLARMRAEHLADSAGLWDYFYDRVDRILRAHGLSTSGWEELASRKTVLNGRPALAPNPRFVGRGFTAWVWNDTPGAEDTASRLATAGYDIVLAPVTRMYMDQAYNANPEEPGVDWGGHIELDTVYDFVPLASPRVRGLEATLFTETVRDPARIDYLVMPRLAAVAERAWAPDPAWAREPDASKAAAQHRAAWSGFVNALGQRVLPRLDLEHAGVDYRIAPPGLRLDGDRVLVNHVLPGILLRYTTDGSDPTTASRQVTGPIGERGLVKVAAFDRNGRRGQVAGIDHR